ncbi:ABC transporter permease [Undibacterium arcticum]
MIGIDGRWGKTETWTLIRNYSGAFTAGYYLTAFDLRFDSNGSIARESEDSRLYMDVFGRTFLISAAVTVICLLLAYPVAYLLANLPARTSNLLMILVLLPFWTSILVRTTAWVVLLQSEGLVNQALLYLGLTQEPLKLIFNRFGVLIAITHILLPYAILSLYSVMKKTSPRSMCGPRARWARGRSGRSSLSIFRKPCRALAPPGCWYSSSR